jgi:hypothetical protein
VKISTAIRTEKEFVDKINTLVKQGGPVKTGRIQKWDAIWKLFVFDMKKGTMKSLLNSIANTLPTGNNLLQRGKSTTDNCKKCNGNNVIKYILTCLDTRVLSDLEGYTALSQLMSALPPSNLN